jgi:hypothetical protein
VELLPLFAAQLQRHLKAQAKPARGVLLQPDDAAMATVGRARSAQQRLPRSHPLATPLAGACAAAAAKGGQLDVIGVLECITALLPPPGQPLWPQVYNDGPAASSLTTAMTYLETSLAVHA